VLGDQYGVSSEEIDMNRVLSNPHIYITEENNMSEYRYDATAIGSGTRLRYNHNTSSATANSYPAGTVFSGNELFTATEQLSNAGGVYQRVGDQWLKVEKVNGKVPVTSTGAAITSPVWVAIINMTTPICTLVDNGPILPPPTDPIPPQEILFTDFNGVKWRSTTFTKV
jgi:hypothetical protein